MKNYMKTSLLLVALTLITVTGFAQEKQQTSKSKTMNTYVIERQIPGAGKLTANDLQGISQKSCSVLKEMGPQIEWVQSYVVEDKIFCVYRAENEELLRTHAAKGGFPINTVYKLSTIISPATATAKLADIKN